MSRPASGSILTPGGKRKSWALRFRAYGKRRFVSLPDCMSREEAERELRHILADVERGIWRPAKKAPLAPEPSQVADGDPLFCDFAAGWVELNETDWKPETRQDYLWALQGHLCWFKDFRLSEITAEAIDQFTAHKRAQGNLSANSINKTLSRLAQVLELATDYELIPKNPAAGSKRRLKGEPRKREWVKPEQLMTLVDNCGERGFRPVVEVLAGCGLRNGEACNLRWGEVNLVFNELTVRESKTEAGTARVVAIPEAVAAELRKLHESSAKTGDDDPVFLSRDGAQQTVRNVEARLKPAIKLANAELEIKGIEPIPESVGPHGLRRTYASVRFALGDDPVWTASQLGHRASAFSMDVYAKAVSRESRLAGAHLQEFRRALHWAKLGRLPSKLPVSGGQGATARRPPRRPSVPSFPL